MLNGALPTGYSARTPAVVMRPIAEMPRSVNQRAPSGPAVMLKGAEIWPLRGNSVTAPAVVMRPILPGSVQNIPALVVHHSVNQRAPSGPAVIPPGAPNAMG